MELQNFGSILSFAAELEAADHLFYEASAANPACAQHAAMLSEFAADTKKNEKTMLRVRRENVTEMILEQITGFTSEPFLTSREGIANISGDEVLAKAQELEEKAVRFYSQAAERIKALPEVSRSLQRMAKCRSSHEERLADLLGRDTS